MIHPAAGKDYMSAAAIATPTLVRAPGKG